MGDCGAANFDFSLTFMTRALTTAVTNRALFETIHSRSSHEVQAGWSKLTKILDYLTTFLPLRAFIHSTQDLSTTNALIPLVAYLCLNDGKFPSEDALKRAVNWLYAALMWARYTGQVDQRLEADVALIVREASPFDALRSQIIDQRGRIDVQASDFAGRGAQNPFYRGSFILAKAHGAVDWFNGLPLGKTYGDAYRIHSHHVFPQSLLYSEGGFDRNDFTHKRLVNEIANRAFLTAESNISLSASRPEEYLPKVEENFPGALTKQFIPMEPALWRMDRYRDFLETHRDLIARKLNEFMNSLISEPEETHHRPVTDLIPLGESYTLEFKSTLQWDVVHDNQNKALRLSVLKTIAAFLNSQGGTLVIGVEDDGSIIGLAPDFKLLSGSDRFKLITEHIGHL